MAVVDAKTEEELRFSDRLDRFVLMGYSTSDATALALSSVDWRYVERLIDRGCPPALAREIAE